MYIVPKKFGAVVVSCTTELFIEFRKYHDYMFFGVRVRPARFRSRSIPCNVYLYKNLTEFNNFWRISS